MAIKSKTFSLLCFIFTCVCVCTLIISFASDYWLASSEKDGFQHIGLWSVCFRQYLPPSWSLVDKYYNGCWWVFDKELDDIRHFLFPSWFTTTQSLVTVGLVFELIAIILMVVNAINCFPFMQHKDNLKLGFCISVVILHFLTGLFLAISVILFGTKASNERTWLERPDDNYLSWSFGLCVLAAFMAIIAGMCQVLEFFRVRLEQGRGKEPSVYLTNQAPPSSNYAYSTENLNAGMGKMQARPTAQQPEYSKRYAAAQGLQSGAKEPKDVFKVSGSGEVYINRLADYDNKRENQNSRDRYANGYAPPSQQNRESRRAGNYSNKDDESHGGINKYTGTDYEESKKMEHTPLPEYVPKTSLEGKKTKSKSVNNEDSDDNVMKKSISSDSEVDKVDQKKKTTTSGTKTRKSSKTRSDSERRKKKKNKRDVESDNEISHSDSERSRKRSKHRAAASDDESSGDRRRNSKKSGSKRRSSRSRSHSRDLNISYSDSQIDSDDASSRHHSRRRHKKDSDVIRKSSRRRSTSRDRKGKEKSSKKTNKQSHEENYSDDQTNLSGSEYSNRPRARSKSGREPDKAKRIRSRDFSDSESVRSKQNRRGGDKHRGTYGYSSYYEY